MAKPHLSASQRLNYAIWLLRLALAFVFAYAAISALVNPGFWLGFIPPFVPATLAKPSLDVFSFVQLVLAAWLLWGKWLRYAAGLSCLLLTALTLTNLSSLIITFRDVGLILAAASLALLAD